MRVLIIEDEPTAAQKLTDMLLKTDSEITVLDTIQSVEEAVHWLRTNTTPDLAFVDVQLADDVSFEIFNHVEVQFPIIFTTAYDQYILEALEHNSIDYLLKPLQEDRLQKALEKVRKLESHFVQYKFNKLFEESMGKNKSSKKRLLVKRGIDYVSVSIKNIAYFFTEHKLVFLMSKSSEKYIIDKTLTELEEELDPEYFFRANRKYLVHIDAIEKFKSDSGKVLLQLHPPTREEVCVSKENAPNFRYWIETF
ncbi:Two-component system response regulator [Fulvivirga imtechensis AK7]|uniref:Two-component system response regulator n=1 Tax=Fulvivirga imtechensis AK7 TaxID=1237149 RepID=L8K017_9BACT|nr:LytTR family DNA-binding domain-containing protein [Fulvivirga imtechensis]ELR72807.1 Two-component system response regulator [Fulvivirga imtechensis AK7]